MKTTLCRLASFALCVLVTLAALPINAQATNVSAAHHTTHHPARHAASASASVHAASAATSISSTRAASDSAASAAAADDSAPNAVSTLGIGNFLQAGLALVIVVGLILGGAWLVRRFGLQPTGRNAMLKTISGISFGGKERVIVVEIADTWLVLGVAPGNIRLLHTLPARAGATNQPSQLDPSSGDNPDAGNTPPKSFSARFRAALSSEARKRFSRPPGANT